MLRYDPRAYPKFWADIDFFGALSGCQGIAAARDELDRMLLGESTPPVKAIHRNQAERYRRENGIPPLQADNQPDSGSGIAKLVLTFNGDDLTAE